MPTDSHQRDERPGGTGEIAAFTSTAAYLHDVSCFLSDWQIDMDLEQRRAAGLAPGFGRDMSVLGAESLRGSQVRET